MVVSEELLILASCLLRPMSRNSVLEEFSAVVPEKSCGNKKYDEDSFARWRDYSQKSILRQKIPPKSLGLVL